MDKVSNKTENKKNYGMLLKVLQIVSGVFMVAMVAVMLVLMNKFDISIETIKLDDTRLSSVWGPEIYRLSLTAKKQQIQGKNSFTVSKL